jgi:anti-sigma regulatory factor (Ser/Thr protein kinase)
MVPFYQRSRQKRRAKRANSEKRVRSGQAAQQPAPQSVAPPGESAANDPTMVSHLPETRPPSPLEPGSQTLATEVGNWQMLQTYRVPSQMGNERLAMSYVAEAVKPFHLPERRLDQLGTAVAEATMNAMEHGNHYNPALPVMLQIFSSDAAIAVCISDKGGTGQQPAPKDYEAPDIEAKLAELQAPRGWGLFLIQNMVDEMHVLSNEDTHTIELILHLEDVSSSNGGMNT